MPKLRSGDAVKSIAIRLLGPAAVSYTLTRRRLCPPLDSTLAALADTYLSRWPRSFETQTRLGSWMTGSTQDLLQRYIYVFGTWEPDITRWVAGRLRPGDGFVDVGANVGYYALLASKLVGAEGCVVAVEPLPESFVALKANLALNAAMNVRAVNMAASDRKQRLLLYGGAPGNSGPHTDSASEESRTRGRSGGGAAQ